MQDVISTSATHLSDLKLAFMDQQKYFEKWTVLFGVTNLVLGILALIFQVIHQSVYSWDNMSTLLVGLGSFTFLLVSGLLILFKRWKSIAEIAILLSVCTLAFLIGFGSIPIHYMMISDILDADCELHSTLSPTMSYTTPAKFDNESDLIGHLNDDETCNATDSKLVIHGIMLTQGILSFLVNVTIVVTIVVTKVVKRSKFSTEFDKMEKVI